MRSRHHHRRRRRPFHALSHIGSWTSTNMACRFRQDLLFSSAVSKLFFDPVRNSRSRFHFPSLAEGYYWLHLVRKSRGYLDWDLGVRAHRAQNSKGAVERKARRGERRATILRQPLRFQAFSVVVNLRRYEFLVRFFLLPEIIFLWFCFSFCARKCFFWVFFSLILMQGTERWWVLKVFCRLFFFFVLGCRFVSEWKEEVSCIQGLEKTRRESFRFLFSMTLVSINCLILFTDSFGIWTWKVFCKCFCW